MLRTRLAAPANAVPLAGIGLMLLGILLFAANDALGKWLVASVTLGQVMLIRSLAALAVLAPFLRGGRGAELLPRANRPLHALRAVLSSAEVALFYTALGYLPLATVMTFYLAGPIYVTALSALLLKERVGPVRWTAVVLGFAGVLVALGPELGNTTLPALIAVLGSLTYALFIVATRRLADANGGALIVWQLVAGLGFGLVLVPFGWAPLTGEDWVLLVIVGVVSMGAHVCINRALALAPASAVVPFQYTLIVWAVLFGYVFFNEVPTIPLLCGAGLIVASGVFIFLREARRAC